MDFSQKDQIDISGKQISIIGLGRSGVAAAKLAQHFGANVYICDSKISKENDLSLKTLEQMGIHGETGEHSERVYDVDLMVVSPGVPKNTPLLQKAFEKDIPIVGEIEFAYWFSQYPIIAVTGSNGKTTTVSLLGELFQTDLIHGAICGNIGIPFSQEVLFDQKNPDPKRVYILEISSFQMEFINHFKPDFSLYLNVSPDHLDRHGSMDEYIACKVKMSQNQIKTDTLVYNQEDLELREEFINHPANTISFSSIHQTGSFRMNETKIYGPNQEKLIDLVNIKIPGQHNIENIIAAATISLEFGLSLEHIANTIASFSGVEHRLEFVKTIDDVTFINDSKATNLDSVIVALNSFSQPLILILGGRNKGADFHHLLPYVQVNQVKQIIAYGESRHDIVNSLGDAVRSNTIIGLKDAIVTAKDLASPGDVILLSPGCASFDQFENYEARGQMFKKWVKALEFIK
ncbi:MAG: UDP-N-acetylmuramoyl-L-alanine--D-glutamate ligase [Candidatus Marinimicrobia bacterium]|jgi:UDP-N-acetylmuramoylalanine--D-glutamate ligase|nr:UDP-N-acetylmuramoyl-L-alanine--D-glutamate ligase [Candidatus Neomarinimicrobiota bacterium]MBT3495892.1 UDP-N-acetylmuramoyl-L-alanine--D-glutamate ligase [Candidatus Neomarinimicrobiota bacterium]MBT3692417.1 UDP-N-acetylmuramoyl-L-alanine--D-glutamate ligase [Candidatus Neomarinimicrobiota bacterium]MBT3732930.1 UDP-N-acetylmuramoyl-L-alanine--D-glutamate ligase [Candidatus Neomarinimicrobiota bacterium]MBT4144418.1 UDP-N-acetylmuramoyl-L-alanine--D-glutamate ligase [Candidatus Neomarini